MRLFLTVIFFINVIPSFGQSSTSILEYNTSNGLPSSEVYDVEEDTSGLIWLSTDHGVVRYDGYDFDVFSTEDGLIDNTILKIYSDVNGRLWFIGLNNLLCYFNGEKFIPYKWNKVLVKFFSTEQKGRYIYKIVVDLDDNLFFNISRVRNEIFFIQNGKLNKLAPEISGKEYGDVFVYSPSSFRGQSITRTTHLSSNTSSGQKTNLSYLELKNGNSIVSNAEEFSIYEEGKLSRKVKHDRIKYHNLYEDRNGCIWFLEENDIFGIYDLKNHRWKDLPRNIEQSQINDVLHDAEGNFWMADQERGFLKAGGMAIRQLKATGIHNRFTSLRVFQDELYAMNSVGQLFKLFSADKMTEIFRVDQSSSENTNLLDFCLLEDNIMVVGGASNMIDLSSNKILYEAGGSTKVLLPLKDSFVVGTNQGLRIYDKKRKKFSSVKDYNYRTNALYQDKRGTIWIGSTDGLYSLSGGSLKRINSPKTISANRIMDIQGRNLDIFLATRGQGVISWSPTDVRSISLEDGLISNLIETIYFENDSVLWAGSRVGLSRIIFKEKGDLDVMNYTVKTGLPSNEINDIIFFKNQIWLATSSGIASFYPRDLTKNKLAPRLTITKVLANGKIQSQKELLNLKHNVNDIAIHFAGLSHSAEDKVLYKYRLKGFQNDWKETQLRTLYFSNLIPGDYSFELLASNEHNVWTKSPLRVEISISEKWFQSTWFKILVLLFSALLTYLLIRWYNESQRKKYNTQTRIAELQQLAMSSSMNPHFIFNALNAVQSNINQEKLDEANEMLIGFSRLIRLNLQGRLSPTVSVEECFQKLELYLETEQIRIGDKLKYDIQIEENLNPKSEIPSMIIQPFVENAIWHGILPEGRGGHISISARKLDFETIEIRIEDDGVGLHHKLAKRNNHVSISTVLTKERLKLLSQSSGREHKINVLDKRDLGMKENGVLVTIELPA